MSLKIILADDHQIVIDGIRSILHNIDYIQIVGEANNGLKVIQMVALHKPDLVILDINMPKMDGIEATLKIRKDFPNVKVLILTMYNDSGFIKKMAEAGAHGFILKNTGTSELKMAIDLIMEGHTYYGKEVTSTLIKSYQKPDQHNVKLTPREKEVLGLLSEGLTTPEIANKLFIASHTVESHRKNLLSKCGQRTAAGLVKFAIENKLF